MFLVYTWNVFGFHFITGIIGEISIDRPRAKRQVTMKSYDDWDFVCPIVFFVVDSQLNQSIF